MLNQVNRLPEAKPGTEVPSARTGRRSQNPSSETVEDLDQLKKQIQTSPDKSPWRSRDCAQKCVRAVNIAIKRLAGPACCSSKVLCGPIQGEMKMKSTLARTSSPAYEGRLCAGYLSRATRGLSEYSQALECLTNQSNWSMKTYIVVLMLGVLALALTGCETPYGTPDRTGTGALAGGGIGAASGALIGSASGSAGEGALIGGAVGAIAGGLIGHSMDMDEQARLRAQAPQTYVRVEQGQPLSVADVKALAQARLSDDVIISQIRNSRTVYHLGVSDIIDLKNSGVSERVIDYMINTATATGGAAAVAAPMPAGPAVVEAAPPPAPVETVLVSPGPGYVWVGGEWVWNGGWVWVGGHWVLPPYPHAVWVGGYWGRGPRGWYHSPGHWR